MHRNLIKLTLICCVTQLVACNNIKVHQDYIQNANFKTLHQFAWLHETQKETGDARVDNSIIDNRIRQAIEAVLISRGYSKSQKQQADFLLAYQYVIRDKFNQRQSSTHIVIGGRHHHHSHVNLTLGNTQSQREVFDLIIDVVDQQTKKVLWQGISTRPSLKKLTPEAMNKRMKQTAAAILSQFPPY